MRGLISAGTCALPACGPKQCAEDVLPPVWTNHDASDPVDPCAAKIAKIDQAFIDDCTSNVDAFMSKEPNIARRLAYAKKEGDRDMDYQTCLIDGGFDRAVIGDKVYNRQDAGNYLWGCGMAKLDIPLVVALAGAQWNDFRNACAQNLDITGCKLGRHWTFDSPIDQEAIKEGYAACSGGL
jgi:hypothetical protein